MGSRIARITQIFMLPTATCHSIKSLARLHIRGICDICERIKIYSNLLPIYFQYLLSHRVHEVALGAREDEDGEEEGDAHEDGAVEETTPVEGATT